MTQTPHDKSEALLNSPMQKLSSRAHQFCMRHDLPRVHGCVWDRHCRYWGAPRRISLLWGCHEWRVDLPGYDQPLTYFTADSTMREMPGEWQLLPQFHHSMRPGRSCD